MTSTKYEPVVEREIELTIGLISTTQMAASGMVEDQSGSVSITVTWDFDKPEYRDKPAYGIQLPAFRGWALGDKVVLKLTNEELRARLQYEAKAKRLL